MEYRTACAETPEQKQKEQSFMGLGLTSRKNLCLHPEVSDFDASVPKVSIQQYLQGVQGEEG